MALTLLCRNQKGPRLDRGPFLQDIYLLRRKGRQLYRALLRLLSVTRRQKRRRDQEQTHNTAQLRHGETPPVSPRAARA
ncbi:hypothetical protein BQ8482_60194 [Mesorhizobium delmotii]|uniref:Uncharacterized protein n=1 Tax=Mesorhizobium delmotii TaxID=1631247 RepID=A0A2P9AVF3_9HYPH|nr:hypothetical protein BQ8482_60194 [Mesorhizobium delmotii]